MIRNFHKFPFECWQLKFHDSQVTLENLMDDLKSATWKSKAFIAVRILSEASFLVSIFRPKKFSQLKFIIFSVSSADDNLEKF